MPSQQQHLSHAKATGRGRRKVKVSRKARSSLENGEEVPGVSSLSALESGRLPPSIRRPGANSSRSRMGPTDMTPPSSTLQLAPDGTAVPSFATEHLAIYHWPAPNPTQSDCSALSQSRRSWKEKQDKADAKLDQELFADDADDWSEFAGDPSLYDELERSQREFCIARTFINRAKRAFRAGKAWKSFEAEEEAMDSSQAPQAEKDPGRRKTRLGEDLDNGVRLAVFDGLKERLCNEIWLEKYIPTAAFDCGDSKMASGAATVLGGEEAEVAGGPPANGYPHERTVDSWEITSSGSPWPVFMK